MSADSAVPVLAALAAALAVAAAVRSTWSPCGISMLSSMTPLAERGRGHRYAGTVAWFLSGAVLGGLTLGMAAALGALVVGAVDPSPTARLTVAAVVALACAALDAGISRPALPHHRRQVDELWFGRFRRWVYASGFGWQIGTGVATYIMTAAVYAMVATAALTGSPLVALAVCTLFGAVRGLAVLTGAGLTDTSRLMAFHRRFDALGPASRWTVAGAQVVVASAAASAAWGALGAAVVAAAVILALLARQAMTIEDRTAFTSGTSTVRAR